MNKTAALAIIVAFAALPAAAAPSGKLGISETSGYHRRVLAVLAYLRG